MTRGRRGVGGTRGSAVGAVAPEIFRTFRATGGIGIDWKHAGSQAVEWAVGRSGGWLAVLVAGEQSRVAGVHRLVAMTPDAVEARLQGLRIE